MTVPPAGPASPRPSLAERHAAMTRALITDAAITLLTAPDPPDLSVRAVARQAGISERTIFRHFATHSDLLDAVAQEVARRIAPPADPRTLGELRAFPAALYGRFETIADLMRAALQSELYPRLRALAITGRAAAIDAILAGAAAERDARERHLAAANLLYHLSASAWHFYRFRFDLPPRDAVDCASLAVRNTLLGLGLPPD